VEVTMGIISHFMAYSLLHAGSKPSTAECRFLAKAAFLFV
jgi:hypothetical protein